MNAPLLPHQMRPSLEAMAEAVRTREDFAVFARALHGDLTNEPGGWANNDLPAYLDGLTAWADDMEGYFRNRSEPIPEQPTWKLMAQLLLAARVYE